MLIATTLCMLLLNQICLWIC